jgi:sialate O-acetylesterase
MKILPRFVILMFISLSANAAVKVHGIFVDHMVLQRDLPIPVYGTADAGETITVGFSGQTLTGVADKDGKWCVTLKAMKACGQPASMTISGKEKLTINDIVIGDVWICSGQSNMQLTMQDFHKTEDIAAANFPLIRQFDVPRTESAVPLGEVSGSWVVCNPQQAAQFTATGFYFCRKLHQETRIPMGIIQAAWSGSPIEPYISSEAKAAVPELADTQQAGEQPAPWHIRYCGMISSLIRFPIKGAVWYQGETNAMVGNGDRYFFKQKALINGWRSAWRIGDFPFYFIQLPAYQNSPDQPEDAEGWTNVRIAQLKTLSLPHTGMAVAIDLANPGDPGDIHPLNKRDVGERLALWALAKDYGKKNLVYSGPLYKAMRVEGRKIRIGFDHTGTGLMVGVKKGLEPTVRDPAGKLKRFAIAGEDKKWVWADAVIEGPTVVLSSPSVAKPVAVRYACAKNPEGCNLYNKEGLPASPFKTDSW